MTEATGKQWKPGPWLQVVITEWQSHNSAFECCPAFFFHKFRNRSYNSSSSFPATLFPLWSILLCLNLSLETEIILSLSTPYCFSRNFNFEKNIGLKKPGGEWTLCIFFVFRDRYRDVCVEEEGASRYGIDSAKIYCCICAHGASASDGFS